MREAVTLLPEKLFGDEASLHGEHGHAVFAVERFRGDAERRNVLFVPIENQEIFCAVLRGGRASFDDHPHVGFGRERDRAFERHVQRCDAQRAAGEHQAVHTLGHGVRDYVGRENVRAGGKMRAVLLDAALRKNDEWMLF